MTPSHGGITRRRGSGLLYMTALVALLGTLCATIMVRSLEAYRDAAMLEMRLAVRAAAEGAVVHLLRHPDVPDDPIALGACRVTIHPSDAGTSSYLLVVEFRRSGDAPAHTERYRATFEESPDGKRRLRALETAP